MSTAPVGTRTAARRTARWSVGVLLVGGLALVAPPTATAVERRTVVVEAPATVVAGVPFDVTVTVENRSGDPAQGYRGTVAFRTDDRLVRSLPARYSFTQADHGTHTFTGVTLVGTGAHRLRVADVQHPRLRGVVPVEVTDAGAVLEGQVLSGLDPVTGGTVRVYDAVTGRVVGSASTGPESYEYRITGLPAGDIKVGAVVPGPYERDWANNKDSLAEADVFTLQPGQTLVQGWGEENFGPYLDVEYTG